MIPENIGKDLELAAELLSDGELVAIPTETVYGLAANATNPLAIAHIFEVKNRPHFDPLIVHFGSLEAAKSWVNITNPIALKLAEAFWPGPLTLLVDRPDAIPAIVSSGLDTLAIRVPNHPLTLALLQRINFPLAAPSANPFGYVSPTQAMHVHKQLGDKIPYILDGGNCEIGIESTIVGVDGNEVSIFREGGISREEIEEVLGFSISRILRSSSKPQAPGMLVSHYSPNKKVVFSSSVDVDNLVNNSFFYIAFKQLPHSVSFLNGLILSEAGDLKEAASNLFQALRKADDSDAEIIIVEAVPEEGIGRAINDRLVRAVG